jgi:hypothetical protein
MRTRPDHCVNAAVELVVAHGVDLLARVAMRVEYPVGVGCGQLLAVGLHRYHELFRDQAAVAGSEVEVCWWGEGGRGSWRQKWHGVGVII